MGCSNSSNLDESSPLESELPLVRLKHKSKSEPRESGCCAHAVSTDFEILPISYPQNMNKMTTILENRGLHVGKIVEEPYRNYQTKVTILFANESSYRVPVCVKIYPKDSLQAILSLQREMDFAKMRLSRSFNPHIVRYLNLQLDPVQLELEANSEHATDCYVLVTQKYSRSLSSFSCEQPENSQYPLHLLFDQILYALEEVWLCEYLHMDVKPENIFVEQSEADKPPIFVLGDFSSCKQISTEEYDGYTLAFAAPERLPQNREKYKQFESEVPKERKNELKIGMDIFSFGVTMLTLAKLWEPSGNQLLSNLGKNLFKSMTQEHPLYISDCHAGRITHSRLRMTGFGVTSTVIGLPFTALDSEQLNMIYKFKLEPTIAYLDLLESKSLFLEPAGISVESDKEELIFRLLWSVFVLLTDYHGFWVLEVLKSRDQEFLKPLDEEFHHKCASLWTVFKSRKLKSYLQAQVAWENSIKLGNSCEDPDEIRYSNLTSEPSLAPVLNVLRHPDPDLNTAPDSQRSHGETQDPPHLELYSIEEGLGRISIELIEFWPCLENAQRDLLALFAPTIGTDCLRKHSSSINESRV